MRTDCDVLVIGAGICGIATAYQLAARHGGLEVVIVDPRPPLTLTSDKSTECYRNWWPTAAMVRLMNRSIDLLEELSITSDHAFELDRRGYLYVTAEEDRLAAVVEAAQRTTTFGAGELRVHPGDMPYEPSPERGLAAPPGADLFVDGDALRRHLPFLTSRALGGIHVRRAGRLDAHGYGRWMLDEALAGGAELVRAEVVGFDVTAGRLEAARCADGTRITCRSAVVATGPLLAATLDMLDAELPVHTERHLKVAFKDHLGVVPRSAPMTIWMDPQQLDWSPEEERGLIEIGRDDLLGELPGGCHFRPEGGAGSRFLLALWGYDAHPVEPTFPVPDDPLYPEVMLRGLTTMIPGFEAYLVHLPASFVDGGYYTRVPDNMPLVGPWGPDGVVIASAVSGYGIMASAAVGELAAAHVLGRPLPDHAGPFLPSRFTDARYVASLAALADTGQI